MAAAEQRLMTQSDFAKLMGWNKSTVTRAKQGGRIVMASGLVDVEASRARLEATGGMRFDVAARHGRERAAKTAAGGPQEVGAGGTVGEGAKTAPAAGGTPWRDENRADAQARKESAAADLLEIELAQKRGQVIPKDDVDQALKTFAASTRARLDTLPDQLAPLLAPVGDLGEIHALLAEHLRLALAGIADDLHRAEAALVAPVK